MLHEINFVRFSKKLDIPIGPLPLDLTHVLCDQLEAENVIVIQPRLDIVRGSYAVAKSARSRANNLEIHLPFQGFRDFVLIIKPSLLY
jgi:hypothetical protein